MPAAPDELYLQLIYRRYAALLTAAATPSQAFQVRTARCRMTAALHARGWWLPELVGASGGTQGQVRHWNARGQRLGYEGLVVPGPGRSEPSSAEAIRLTVSQIAQQLDVNQATVRRWIRSGKLAASRARKDAQGRWAVDADALRGLGLDEAAVSVAEFARRHGVTEPTVRRWIKHGQLPAARFGKRGGFRIPADALPTGPRRRPRQFDRLSELCRDGKPRH